MTALAERRHRALMVALVAVLGALALVSALTVVGARALWTSTGGEEVDVGPPELTFPSTPTALVVGLDATGVPASLAVVVDRPGGQGGNVVVAPASIDASGGEGDDRLPVDETAALAGPDSVGDEASIALGVSFDVVELADATRLTTLLAPFGTVEVTLPADVTGADGQVVAAAGTTAMDAAAMAAVLTSRDPAVPAATRVEAAAAVWEAITGSVGEGAGTAEPTVATGAAPTVTAESVIAGLAAGPAASWSLRSSTPTAADNPRQVDVAVVDRVEAALVFGQLAPGRASASNPSASFRIVAAFTPEQLGDRGWTNADIAYQAVSQVLFLRGNVLSVDTTPDGAPAATTIQVMQPGLNVEGMVQLFGDVDTVAAERRIVGVDAQLVLGEGYLDFLDDAVDRGLVTVGSTTADTTGGDD